VSDRPQSAVRIDVPRAIIPPDDALRSQMRRSVLDDVTMTTPRQRRRNLRLARLRNREEVPYCSLDRQTDFQRERPALVRQMRNKKPGDPSRSVPLAFDETGNFLAVLAEKIPLRQASQAHLLLEFGLAGKARRQAWCCLIGRRRDCFSGNVEHRFFTKCRCGNRYCPTCGPQSFRDLFNRHSRLRPLVEELLHHRSSDHRQRVLAKIDFTTLNTGEMPSAADVRQFNKDIRRFFRALEKKLGISRHDYGFLWCCEFGSGNTNLHAHGIYVGPLLPQHKRQLSNLWAKIRADGSYIVSIKAARSFEAALGHALKYPSKFFEAPPARLAELEVVFDRVRRVHALARFYNPHIEREPGEEGPADAGHCPICGDLLLDAPGWHFVDGLEREGRRDSDVVRIEAGRAKVLTGAGPP
jgi:hypothetical protein